MSNHETLPRHQSLLPDSPLASRVLGRVTGIAVIIQDLILLEDPESTTVGRWRELSH